MHRRLNSLSDIIINSQLSISNLRHMKIISTAASFQIWRGLILKHCVRLNTSTPLTKSNKSSKTRPPGLNPAKADFRLQGTANAPSSTECFSILFYSFFLFFFSYSWMNFGDVFISSLNSPLSTIFFSTKIFLQRLILLWYLLFFLVKPCFYKH